MVSRMQSGRRSARRQADAVWMKSPLYPSYYMNSFHYQTDGWLSPASASVYESSTETLFVGRQDAMQVLPSQVPGFEGQC